MGAKEKSSDVNSQLAGKWSNRKDTADEEMSFRRGSVWRI